MHLIKNGIKSQLIHESFRQTILSNSAKSNGERRQFGSKNLNFDSKIFDTFGRIISLVRGGSRIFSRGGGGGWIFKNVEVFVDFFWIGQIITSPNCALDRRTILCLYVPGFQRQVLKHVKNLSKLSKESIKQMKNKGGVLVAESACNAQNAQFGLVMIDFPSSPKALRRPCFGQQFCVSRECLKKQVKKPFLGIF